MAQEFLRVECGECGNRQVVFSRAASEIDCKVCGEPVALPTGGKPELHGDIVEELEVE
jgi:small subunit ribosomal protein S27e